MTTNLIYKIIIFFLAAGFFSSCYEKKPATEKECLVETSYILKLVQSDEYLQKLPFLKKYETFNKYTTDDYEKNYKKLNELLKNIKIDKLETKIKRDSTSIEYNGLTGKIFYFEIGYYINSKTKEQLEICNFKYSKAVDEKKYNLSYFKSNLQPKLQPILPSK